MLKIFSKVPSRYILHFLILYCLFGLDPVMGSNMKVEFEKFDGKKNFFNMENPGGGSSGASRSGSGFG